MFCFLAVGYGVGSYTSRSDTDEKQLKELKLQNHKLKEQLGQLRRIMKEKNEQYNSLTQQLLELDKLLVKQEQNEKEILEDLTDLAQEKAAPLDNVDIQSYSQAERPDDIEMDEDLSSINTDTDATQQNAIALELNPRKKFPPSAFRTTTDVNVVDENNQVQEFWEQGTSFTAREQLGDYYKISGYFINKQWTRAENVLLISKLNAIKR